MVYSEIIDVRNYFRISVCSVHSIHVNRGTDQWYNIEVFICIFYESLKKKSSA